VYRFAGENTASDPIAVFQIDADENGSTKRSRHSSHETAMTQQLMPNNQKLRMVLSDGGRFLTTAIDHARRRSGVE